MDTNEHLRQRASRLVKHGISQKVLAGKMGIPTSTFSKWLRRLKGIRPVPVTAIDGLNAYEEELAAALRGEETQLAPDTPTTTRSGPPFRKKRAG